MSEGSYRTIYTLILLPHPAGAIIVRPPLRQPNKTHCHSQDIIPSNTCGVIKRTLSQATRTMSSRGHYPKQHVQCHPEGHFLTAPLTSISSCLPHPEGASITLSSLAQPTRRTRLLAAFSEPKTKSDVIQETPSQATRAVSSRGHLCPKDLTAPRIPCDL